MEGLLIFAVALVTQFAMFIVAVKVRNEEARATALAGLVIAPWVVLGPHR